MDIGLGGLVLSRQVGQSIEIGHDVKITVVRIGPNAVRLHIAAPQHMNIARSEIKSQEEIAAAAKEILMIVNESLPEAVAAATTDETETEVSEVSVDDI